MQAQPSRVLLLHSYHPGLQWTRDLTEGFRNEVRESRPELKLQIEYMDTKRFYTAEYRRRLFEFYREKYRDREFDLVVAFDDHAFSFMKKYRSALFPNTPLVFAGVNDYRPEMTADLEQVTGIAEKLGLDRTLEAARRLHPDADTVFVINDRSKTGRANQPRLEALAERYSDSVNFEYLRDYSMPRLREKISSLPRESFVLLLSFNQDSRGRTYSYTRSCELISERANRPLYGVWSFYLDHGLTGGYLTCGKQYGRQAARLGLKVLAGQPAASLPVEQSGKCEFVFDYEMLRKFNLAPADLPASARVINQPAPFYKVSVRWYWAALVLIFISLVLAVTAAVAAIYYRRAKETAARSRRLLQAVLDASPNLISVRDAAGEFTMVNQALADFFGKPPSTFVGRRQPDFLTEVEGFGSRRRAEAEVLETGEPISLGEERLVNPATGEECWFTTTCRPVHPPSGEGLNVLTVSTDITQLKKVETRLEEQHSFVDAILETAAALIVVLDNEGRIIRFNRACEQLTGYSEEEVIGSEVMEIFVPEEEREAIETVFESVQAGEDYVYQENHWLTKDGEQRLIAWRNSVFSPGNSAKQYVVATGLDITSERQTEKELRKREEVFESFFEAANDLIVQVDEFGQILRVNTATCRRLDYSAEELVGHSFLELLEAESREEFVDCFPELLEQGGGRHEVQLQAPEGGSLVVDCSSAAIEEVPEATDSFVLFMRDITELKQREARLRQYEQTIEASTELFAAVDEEWNYLFANEAYLEYHGLDREEIVGENLADVLPSETFETVKTYVRQALEGDIVRYEMVRTHPTLGDRNLDVSYYPITGADGEIRGVAASFHDITARKQAEMSRRKSEQRFRTMASTIDEVFWMGSAQLEEFDYVNPAVEELFGSSVEQFYENPECFFKPIYPEDRQRVREQLEGLAEGGEAQVEFRIEEPEKGLRWCRLRAHPVLEEGEVERLVGTVVDITRLKETQFELENSLDEKETLMQEIHHRVKNNLFIITSLLDMQAMETEAEAARAALQEGVDRIQVMAFVHELLYQDSDLRGVRVDEYLKKLTSELMDSHQAPGKAIEVSYDLEPVELDVDKIVTCGLITNELFTNAVQHAFKGIEGGEIVVRFSETGEQYILEVEDNGVGLPEDFSLSDSEHLGLKLVSSLTENQLRGIIKIQRTPRTVFRVEFEKTPTTERKHI